MQYGPWNPHALFWERRAYHHEMSGDSGYTYRRRVWGIARFFKQLIGR